jgi:hypothetical protein
MLEREPQFCCYQALLHSPFDSHEEERVGENQSGKEYSTSFKAAIVRFKIWTIFKTQTNDIHVTCSGK